ncbi:MAG: PAS domain-containing protein [bacterium]|nr:PAS domain-containing protein [bacterium]
MDKLRIKIPVGRAMRLRLLMGALALGSVLFLTANLLKLTTDFQNSGSWAAFWQAEWQSGGAITKVFSSGLFQFLILALGWSAYLRFRQREMVNIKLRRSEQKFRAIINHAGEAVFQLDTEGNVREWNKAAEQLFRKSRRLVMNKSFSNLDLGLSLELKPVFEDVQRIRRSLTYENHLTQPGESPKILSMTFSFIAPGAGLLSEKTGSFVVIARDITSEKQLETRMSETEKLAGIGQLAAGIAHQLNTPLGSILLSAQMLEDTIQEEDDAEDIRRIIRQTEQCKGIIKGLLNFARPTGRGRSRVNLIEIVKDTTYLLEKSLNVAQVEVKLNTPEEAWILGNRNELEQVFFNLLANSLDAMKDGGLVNICVKSDGPGEFRVDFQDDGEGISKEDRDRIFLPFFTTKDYGKGTGLGLSIVARLVHEHGGRIELESKKNHGTTFSLWFGEAREGQGSTSLIDDSV